MYVKKLGAAFEVRLMTSEVKTGESEWWMLLCGCSLGLLCG